LGYTRLIGYSASAAFVHADTTDETRAGAPSARVDKEPDAMLRERAAHRGLPDADLHECTVSRVASTSCPDNRRHSPLRAYAANAPAAKLAASSREFAK